MQCVTWLGRWDTFTLNHKGYNNTYRTQQEKYICIANWGKLVLQFITALFYVRANVTNWSSFIITNWGSYYKLEQPLLQNRLAITNWGKMYYKLGQVLQIRAIITNWAITSTRSRFRNRYLKNNDEINRKHYKQQRNKCVPIRKKSIKHFSNITSNGIITNKIS